MAAWTIGWNPVKNLDVGVDVLYTAMAKSAFEGAVFRLKARGGAGTIVTPGDTNVWAGILRVQHNFYPQRLNPLGFSFKWTPLQQPPQSAFGAPAMGADGQSAMSVAEIE